MLQLFPPIKLLNKKGLILFIDGTEIHPIFHHVPEKSVLRGIKKY